MMPEGNGRTMAELKTLDLRGVACPMNFVKTQLFLDKMSSGEKVEVLLDQGEPFESVSKSVVQEGHVVEENQAFEEGHCRILIRKG